MIAAENSDTLSEERCESRGSGRGPTIPLIADFSPALYELREVETMRRLEWIEPGGEGSIPPHSPPAYTSEMEYETPAGLEWSPDAVLRPLSIYVPAIQPTHPVRTLARHLQNCCALRENGQGMSKG